jgi:hypothetical protein
MRVLYVGHDRKNPSDFCPGSLVCMSLVEKISSDIQVQNCTVLREKAHLPAWLNGTPIYVDQYAKTGPLRGRDAVQALRELLETESEQSSDVQEKSNPMHQRPQGAVPRMQPSMTRQPGAAREEKPSTEFLNIMPDAPVEEGLDTMSNGAESSNAAISDSKVTDDMLQKFMEERKNSPASASSGQMT